LQILDLKIDNNPWAKLIRDSGAGIRKKKQQQQIHQGLSSQNVVSASSCPAQVARILSGSENTREHFLLQDQHLQISMAIKQQQQQGAKTKGTQNGGHDEGMNNKMKEAADANSLLKEGQQKQQPMKKPAAEWSMDMTSICGDGNSQNALKEQIPEVIQIFCDK
jgi:hypothetical protein